MKQNITFLLLLISMSIQSQTTLQGVVIDKLSKDPLVGASVSIKDGFDGASTDSIGGFKFVTDETGKQVLLVSYIGYKPVEIPLDLTQQQQPFRVILDENPAAIGEVVISAGAFEASDEKKGVVLQPLDIVTIPGANGDITGAINTLPGTTINGETGQLIVRGGAANETRIYIDGLAVRNYYTSALPDLPARSRFSPFQFKGTIFASGGYSAEYGQALSSTLILNTTDMPLQGGASLGLTSVGVNGSYTKLRPKYALSGAVGYTNLGPYMLLIKQRNEIIKAPESISGNFEGRYRTKNQGIVKYGAQGTFTSAKVGYPKQPYETQAFQIGIKNTNVRAFAIWRQPVGDEWTLYSAVQAEANNDEFTPNTSPGFTIKNQATSARVNATYSPNTTIRWRSGAEMNYFKLNNSFAPKPLNHTLGAVFSELETYAGTRVVLRTGLRAERDFYLNASNVAPRISAAYKTGRESQISASWGLFYQTPDDTILLRRSNLGFERAQHYILNYQVTRSSRILRIETFYKKYNALVRTIPTYENTGNGFAQGIELFFRDRKTFQWGDYWISYSYLDTRRLHRNYPVSAMPEFAASHNASFVYKYFFRKPQISANMSYTVQTGRPYFNPTNPTFLGDRTPSYHNFSLQCAKLTSIKGNFTIFVVSVTNVLGLKQVFNYRYSPIPNSQPLEYTRQEIGPPAPRFIFAGCFINIGDKRKKVTKDEALE